MRSQVLIIISFLVLICLFMWGAVTGIPEAKSAVPWLAGAFASELAHLARKSAE